MYKFALLARSEHLRCGTSLVVSLSVFQRARDTGFNGLNENCILPSHDLVGVANVLLAPVSKDLGTSGFHSERSALIRAWTSAAPKLRTLA